MAIPLASVALHVAHVASTVGLLWTIASKMIRLTTSESIKKHQYTQQLDVHNAQHSCNLLKATVMIILENN